MITYSFADSLTVEVCRHACERWHPRLRDADVLFGILFADNDKDGEPAIKSKGYPVLACIKVVSLKDRVSKRFDAEILIDRAVYQDELDDDSRMAMFDHELSHVDLGDWKYVTVDDHGVEKEEIRFERDPLGRPRLRTVTGDWMPGDGFIAVVERHGESAVELINLSRAMKLAEQARLDERARREQQSLFSSSSRV